MDNGAISAEKVLDLAQKLNILRAKEIARLQEFQKKAPQKPLSDIVISSGVLSRDQWRDLEYTVRHYGDKSPRYLLDRKEDLLFALLAYQTGMVDLATLYEGFRRQQQYEEQGSPKKIGVILSAELKALSSPDLQKILSLAQKRILPCPSCQSRYNVSKFPGGKRVKCKKCGFIILIPREVTDFRLVKKKGHMELMPNLKGLKFQNLEVGKLLVADTYSHKYIAQQGGKRCVFTILKAQYANLVHDNYSSYSYPFPRHANLVAIESVGKVMNYPYYLREELEGVTLRERLGGEKIQKSEAMEVLSQILAGLKEGVKSGFVLDMLRPENIHLAEKEGRPQITIEGFALFGKNTQFPPPTHFAHTLPYMAPERFQGQPPSESSHVFSAAVILYEMLTSRLPLETQRPLDYIGRAQNFQISSLPQEVEELGSFLSIWKKMISPQPQQRPSIQEIQQSLKEDKAESEVYLEEEDEGGFTVHWSREALGLGDLGDLGEGEEGPEIKDGKTPDSILMEVEALEENMGGAEDEEDEEDSSVVNQAFDALKNTNLQDLLAEEEGGQKSSPQEESQPPEESKEAESRDSSGEIPTSQANRDVMNADLENLQTRWEEQTAEFGGKPPADFDSLPEELRPDPLGSSEGGEGPGGLTMMVGEIAQDYPEGHPQHQGEGSPPATGAPEEESSVEEGEIPSMDFDPSATSDHSALGPGSMAGMQAEAGPESESEDMAPLPDLDEENETMQLGGTFKMSGLSPDDSQGEDEPEGEPQPEEDFSGTYPLEAIQPGSSGSSAENVAVGGPPSSGGGMTGKLVMLFGGLFLILVAVLVVITIKKNQSHMAKAEKAWENKDYLRAALELDRAGSFMIDEEKKKKLWDQLHNKLEEMRRQKGSSGDIGTSVATGDLNVDDLLKEVEKRKDSPEKFHQAIQICQTLSLLIDTGLIQVSNEKEVRRKIRRYLVNIRENQLAKIRRFKSENQLSLALSIANRLAAHMPSSGEVLKLKNEMERKKWREQFKENSTYDKKELIRTWKQKLNRQKKEHQEETSEFQARLSRLQKNLSSTREKLKKAQKEPKLTEGNVTSYLKDNLAALKKAQKALYKKHKTRGDQALGQDKYKRALDEYRQARRYLYTSEIDGAIEKMERKISGKKEGSDNKETAKNNGNNQNNGGDNGKTDNQSTVSKVEGNFTVLLSKALKAYHENDLSLARKISQAMAKKASTRDEKEKLARFMEKLSKKAAVAKEYKKHYKRGMSALKGENFDKAKEAFTQLVKVLPGDLRAQALVEFSKNARGMIHVGDLLFIEETEVPNWKYAKFLADRTDYPKPPHWVSREAPVGQEYNPVVFVSYKDAQAYARWKGRQLPTVSEWERAAHGKGKKKRRFPWGNFFDSVKANTAESKRGRPAPVGKYYSKSRVRDMIGNVWEWVAYDQGKVKSPYLRPVKGGGFADRGYEAYINTTAHSTYKVKVRDRGFRCSLNFERFYENFLRRKKGQSLPKEKFKDEEGMVYVPAGPFPQGEMGASKFTEAFLIGTQEVTNGEYAQFLQSLSTSERKERTPSNWSGGRYPSGKKDYPVTHVRWVDALAYAKWKGKRLPTPQEWEKACRAVGGRLSRKYPYGMKFNKNLSRTRESIQSGALPAGSQRRGVSFFGCFNMGGNVSEWLAAEEDLRSQKGSKPYMGASYLKPGAKWPAWQKSSNPHDVRLPDLGFRLAQDAQ